MIYHVLHIVENSPPCHKEFGNITELQAWFFSLKDKSGFLYVFKGDRLLLTSGSHRYIVEGNTNHPLFEAPTVGPASQEASLDSLSGLDPYYEELTPSFDDSPDSDQGFDD